MEKATILVIDDDPASVHTLMKYLHTSGFKTTIAPGGERALQQLERAQPDLILLDVLMPGGMDGFETCRRLKANAATRAIPVIFMTALTDTVDKVKGFEAGGADYITKPLQHGEVLARVNVQLALRKAQQQLQTQNALLEEQNTRFQRLSEATFEGIVIHDQGRILEVNQTLAEMLSYERAELIDRDVLEFVPPAFHEIVRQHIRAGDERSYEAEVTRKDGSNLPVEAQAKMMPYQGRNVRVAALRDLSWKRAIEEEKELLEKENLNLKTTLQDRYKFGEIIGKSHLMQEIYELIAHTAVTDANVVILGESGTGKELIARTIHQLSDRHEHRLVPSNCGAIPDNLFESEFFGHRKGAFTGADMDKKGFFEAAHQGTLFLDEVGELSPAMQVKLLRAFQSGEYIPVGENTPRHADVRIIAATNEDLTEQLRKGALRKDFFYRINVVTITLPPLRDRREDIPLLVDYFLKHYSRGKQRTPLPGKILGALYKHDWPGNIRELQNVLQRYLAVGRLDLTGDGAAESFEQDDIVNAQIEEGLKLHEAVEAFEKRYITRTLEQQHWHRGNTATALGLPRRTLHRKMKKLGLH